MIPKVLELSLGSSGQKILFSKDVLDHFSQFRQLDIDSLEAGGQLFAKLT